MAQVRLNVDNLLSYPEAARLLRVSRQTVYAMIDRGELRPVAIADRRFLLRDEVKRLMTKRSKG